MPFRFHRLEIPDVILIEAKAFRDDRGFFLETYKRSEFRANGVPEDFIQDNFSHSTQGTLRGLHYQTQPQTQGKLVRVIRGEIFDVCVDIRRGSPTYRRWVATVLSDKNFQMLYIPVGFAHGFCVLSDEADVVYKTTAEYCPEADCGILWNDPEIGIRWPIAEPILSAKDVQLPFLKDADNGFVFERGSL